MEDNGYRNGCARTNGTGLRPAARKNLPRFEIGTITAFGGTSSNPYQSGVHILGNVTKHGSRPVPELNSYDVVPQWLLPIWAGFKT